jgi:hypothetical protein
MMQGRHFTRDDYEQVIGTNASFTIDRIPKLINLEERESGS